MIEKTTNRLADASVFIASHELFEDGAPQALEGYVAPRAKETEILLFPFKGAPEERVAVRRYKSGKLVTQRRYRWSAPMPHELVAWVRDIAMLVARLVVVGRKIDLFVGVDPMNCLVGIALRKLGIVRAHVVFYTIDYVPKRFENDRLNRFYHRIDEYCSRRADVIWNVSAEIKEARAARSGPARRAPEIVVPIGVHQVAEHSQTERTSRLVYLGIILEKQGLQYVVPALPDMAKRIPDLELDIIGSGPYEPELRKLAEQYGVGDRVRFRGYIKENAEIQRLLTEGGVGLATYDPDPNSFTRFADPSKLKAYLAAGLPILLTDVPAIAPLLVQEGCATIVEPEPQSIAKAVTRLLEEPEEIGKQSAAALAFARNLLWTNVFSDALAESGWT